MGTNSSATTDLANRVKVFLESLLGQSLSKIEQEYSSRLHLSSLYFIDSINNLKDIFNNKMITIEEKFKMFNGAVAVPVILAFALHLAAYGQRARKSTTILPIAVFFIYIFLTSGIFDWITRALHAITEEIPFEKDFPLTVSVLKYYDVPTILVALIVTGLLSTCYALMKYVTFFVLTCFAWHATVPKEVDGSFVVLFFTGTVLALLACLKLIKVMETIFHSLIFSVVSSFLLLHFTILICDPGMVLQFVHSIIYGDYDPYNGLLLVFVALVSFVFVRQLLQAFVVKGK